MRNLKQPFPFKAVTEYVSDLILPRLCPKYSGSQHTTEWFSHQDDDSPPRLSRKIDLVPLLGLFLLPWSILLGFFPRHRESAVKDHRKLVCAESFQQKSPFLICLPMKTTSSPPDQLWCPDCILTTSFQCITVPPDAGMSSKFSSPCSSPSLQIILDALLLVSHMKIQTQDFPWKLHLPSNLSGTISVGNGMQWGD